MSQSQPCTLLKILATPAASTSATNVVLDSPISPPAFIVTPIHPFSVVCSDDDGTFMQVLKRRKKVSNESGGMPQAKGTIHGSLPSATQSSTCTCVSLRHIPIN